MCVITTAVINTSIRWMCVITVLNTSIRWMCVITTAVLNASIRWMFVITTDVLNASIRWMCVITMVTSHQEDNLYHLLDISYLITFSKCKN
jgi:hypothetical protein